MTGSFTSARVVVPIFSALNHGAWALEHNVCGLSDDFSSSVAFQATGFDTFQSFLVCNFLFGSSKTLLLFTFRGISHSCTATVSAELLHGGTRDA